MDRWKNRGGKSQRREEQKREDQRGERVRRKKRQVREKVAKSRNTVFFQWFVAPEGRTVGSLKRRVRSHLARWEMKNCTLLWREAHFEAKMCKTHQVRTTFGSWHVEKVHAVVARSTFASEKAKITSRSEHFWKLRGWKSARRCGAKQISKSKCTKHLSVGPFLEVQMLKKCTPLWREAHFQVKICKAHQGRSTFGSWHVEKVHAVVVRSTFPSQNVQNATCSDHFWTFRCRFAWHAQGIVHLVKSKQNVRAVSTCFNYNHHYTPLYFTPLHFTYNYNYNYNYTNYITLQYTALITLHYNYNYNYNHNYTTLTTLHSTSLHYTTLHSITLHYNYN